MFQIHVISFLIIDVCKLKQKIKTSSVSTFQVLDTACGLWSPDGAALKFSLQSKDMCIDFGLTFQLHGS